MNTRANHRQRLSRTKGVTFFLQYIFILFSTAPATGGSTRHGHYAAGCPFYTSQIYFLRVKYTAPPPQSNTLRNTYMVDNPRLHWFEPPSTNYLGTIKLFSDKILLFIWSRDIESATLATETQSLKTDITSSRSRIFTTPLNSRPSF